MENNTTPPSVQHGRPRQHPAYTASIHTRPRLTLCHGSYVFFAINLVYAFTYAGLGEAIRRRVLQLFTITNRPSVRVSTVPWLDRRTVALLRALG
jgi:hypothetical protein